jgi:hypothetical protein
MKESQHIVMLLERKIVSDELEWSDTYLFPDRYSVSSCGVVKAKESVRRGKDGKNKVYKEKILSVNQKGERPKLSLYDNNGSRVSVYVHKLVAVAFVNPPKGSAWINNTFYLNDKALEVCHLDGNERNNSFENLEWGTRSKNQLDRVRHGTHNNSQKRICPYGHALDSDNLVQSSLKVGSRKCQACTRARAWCALHPEHDFITVSNIIYELNVTPSEVMDKSLFRKD